MPLLMCPNCNASMSEVKRSDVTFDMCPSCRGVWLDRGELEKIIDGVKAERAEFARDRDQFYQDPDAYRRTHPQPQQPPQHYYGERGEHGERGERGERGYDQRGYDQHGRRKRGFDLFDIFD